MIAASQFTGLAAGHRRLRPPAGPVPKHVMRMETRRASGGAAGQRTRTASDETRAASTRDRHWPSGCRSGPGYQLPEQFSFLLVMSLTHSRAR
jgi:hypothetical protein